MQGMARVSGSIYPRVQDDVQGRARVGSNIYPRVQDDLHENCRLGFQPNKKMLKRVQHDRHEKSGLVTEIYPRVLDDVEVKQGLNRTLSHCEREEFQLEQKRKLEIRERVKKVASTLAEGTTHVAMPPTKAKFAFTLAEVLITLGIIGVVAAMTIPTLIEKIRVRQTVVRLRTVHSIFSQAVKLAVAENGDLDGLDLGNEDTQAASEKLYNVIKPHLKNAQDCGKKQGCFKNDYLALNGKTKWAWQPGQHSAYARGVLLNGIQYAVWSAGSGCRNSTECGVIFVDINGNTKPNRAGVDYFKFVITPDNVIPTKSNGIVAKYGDRCIYNDNDSRNGADCTAWVLEKENMDYLKKPISW